ncbi:MAG: HD domain-containing protein [Saprospiraceae bacterium]|nr:HD domain-containing protein [Saprospiraceae bacterium]
MPGIKILNDPIYGFVMIPKGLILSLMDHAWFQRLRRIKQLGLSYYVYPGAVHSRFHHAVGVFHLMSQAIDVLRQKGVAIQKEEAQAAQIAALLHDVGHGPFSHVLENSLVPLEHEQLTLMIMDALNRELNGSLDLVIEIFKGNHPKKFLCELVAGQLDVDRMDYLNRDSFYSGVVEGTIGYHRLLTMMDVVDNRLVFEEKAGLSIENYLAARRLMYWQVYMHKTSLVAEQMLELLLARCKKLGRHDFASPALDYFISLQVETPESLDRSELLMQFQKIDDSDIEMFLKCCGSSNDALTSYLAKGLLQRNFFKIHMQKIPFDDAYVAELRSNCIKQFNCSSAEAEQMVHLSKMEFLAYETKHSEIQIRTKQGSIYNASDCLKLDHLCNVEEKYYLSVPRELIGVS